jgi:hypothetical protein
MAKDRKPSVETVKRAADLHNQIEELKRPTDKAGQKDTIRPLSPREFIHKRMAELDKKKDA